MFRALNYSHDMAHTIHSNIMLNEENTEWQTMCEAAAERKERNGFTKANESRIIKSTGMVGKEL